MPLPRLMAAVAALASLAFTACTPAAPMELSELTWYLYREWDNKDPLVMQRGLLQLETMLAAKNLGPDGKGDDRQLQVKAIRRQDITVTPWPMERDPQKCLGTAVARESPWPVADHARLQVDPDQLAIEPSAKSYVRNFLDPTDPSCFPTGACTDVKTSNDVVRANAALEVTFLLLKNLRWFDLGDGRKAMVGRSWTPMSSTGMGGAVFQSYTLDAFIPRTESTTWRYQSLFNENELKVVTTDEIQVAVVTGSTDEAFKTADRVIAKRYHGQ